MIKAIDSFNFLLKSHHKRTALISYNLGRQMQLSDDELLYLVIAASLHDIGATSVQERDMLIRVDVIDPTPHCILGYNILRPFEAFNAAARIIKHHHIKYKDSLNLGNEEVLFQSHILHLADRVDILLLQNEGKADPRECVTDGIRKSVGEVFHPDVFAAFLHLSRNDEFWDEIGNVEIDELFDNIDFTIDFDFTIDSMLEFTSVISRIIDFRSRFTASHSYTVAQLCMLIGGILGFSDEKCKKLMIAGYLHDVGKIGIDPQFIEKDGPLNDDEFRQVKLHTTYTEMILSELSFSGWFEEIVGWAKNHHEKVDGKGYPNGLDGDSLDTGVKVLAYSDIISALMEDRPYRKGLSIDVTLDILDKEMKSKICPEMFKEISDNSNRINDLVMVCHELKETEYKYIL